MIGEKSHFEELETGIRETHAELAVLDSGLKTKQEAVAALDLKSFSDAVKKVEKEMTTIEMRIAQIEFEKKRANDAVTRNRTENAAIEEEINKLKHQHDTATADLARIEQRKTEYEGTSHASTRELVRHD